MGRPAWPTSLELKHHVNGTSACQTTWLHRPLCDVSDHVDVNTGPCWCEPIPLNHGWVAEAPSDALQELLDSWRAVH